MSAVCADARRGQSVELHMLFSMQTVRIPILCCSDCWNGVGKGTCANPRQTAHFLCRRFIARSSGTAAAWRVPFRFRHPTCHSTGSSLGCTTRRSAVVSSQLTRPAEGCWHWQSAERRKPHSTFRDVDGRAVAIMDGDVERLAEEAVHTGDLDLSSR
eukprot:360578-Chlamydomonas_euryale.AAC.11